MNPVASKYIPEIDGLRAFAVMAVILFHLQITQVPGGYVGVDVFFVISGYLISGALHRELSSTGVLQLTAFYVRRARRLLPALYAVLIASSVLAVLTLSHFRLKEYGASQMAAALSAANIHFYMGSGYFETASDRKPLLHTWSLGVEEQFYLIWPMLLMGMWRWRQRLLVGAVAVFFVSWALAEWLLRTDPSAAFFLVPTRMYEFIVGAVVALHFSRMTGAQWAKDTAMVGGLGLIGWAVCTQGPQAPYPGWHALVPCLGAALVIWAGGQSNLAWCLNNPLARFLGRTSYSTYLVHWPLIVFYRLIKGREHLKWQEQLSLLLLTFVFGYVLSRYVENRYRGRPSQTDRPFMMGLLSVTVLLIAMGWAFQQDRWIERRTWAVSRIGATEIEHRRKARFLIRQTVCSTKGWEHCDDLVPSKRNGLVLGDSHAIDAYNALVTKFPADNVVLSDLGGCPPHPDIAQIVNPGHPDLQKCQQLNSKRYEPAFLRQFDYIALNVYMGWYKPEHLAEFLHYLHRQGVKRVLVFGQTWRAQDDVPELVNRVGLRPERLMPLLTPPPNEQLVESTARALGYLYVSKTEALSTGNQFDVFDANEVLFTYDQHHLSLNHSKRLLDHEADLVTRYLKGAP